MKTEWQTFDEDAVLGMISPTMRSLYDAAIVATPTKADTLTDWTLKIRTEFRDAIASIPANYVAEDPLSLPLAAHRHAGILVQSETFRELDLDQPSTAVRTAFNQAVVQANMYLRAIAYGHFTSPVASATSLSPVYFNPDED